MDQRGFAFGVVDDDEDEGENEAGEVNDAGDGKVVTNVLAGVEKEIKDEEGDRAENEIEHAGDGAREVFGEEN